VNELVEVIGAPKLEHDLAKIAERTGDMHAEFARQERQLQRAESALFASHGGKYVKTGRLRRSLTGHTGDSIRRVTAEGLVFGSSLFYGRFQTEHIGPEKTKRGGLKRSGKNEVLEFPPEVRERVLKGVGDYVLKGRR
jgi:hypothetical protein